jgi:hypothetical protein
LRTAQVPFSAFVQTVRRNEVLAVAINDRKFAYRLRPQGKIMQGLSTEHVRGANLVFHTIRPADYTTPYDTMLKNGVQFTAVEKNHNIFFTVGVRGAALCSSMCPAACIV